MPKANVPRGTTKRVPLKVHLMPKAEEPKALPMGTIRSESKGVDLWI